MRPETLLGLMRARLSFPGQERERLTRPPAMRGGRFGQSNIMNEAPRQRGPEDYEAAIAPERQRVRRWKPSPRRREAGCTIFSTSIPLPFPLSSSFSLAHFLGPRGRPFFAPFNLSLILQQVTIIGVVGIAQTLIILTAGIDLSVGAIMVLSSVVMGRSPSSLRRAGRDSLPARAPGRGGLCGCVNGALITFSGCRRSS